MQKVIVYYKDGNESYNAGPYEPSHAKKVADGLGKMGGYDFRFVPADRKAA